MIRVPLRGDATGLRFACPETGKQETAPIAASFRKESPNGAILIELDVNCSACGQQHTISMFIDGRQP
jgi:hypothetical protein